MNKFIRKLAAASLALAMSTGLCACAGGDVKTNVSPLTAADVDVWSAPITEKIVRDLDYDARGEGRLNISAYRNETEGGQIILTPDKDIKAYTVSVSALVGPEGATLPADSVKVYMQKYLQCISTTTAQFTPGWYPDPLLPMATAVEYGENTVAAGDNQGLYITVTPPADQKAGTYTGTVTITADGVKLEVPASVTVWDWTLPEENHLRTLFGVAESNHIFLSGGYDTGELDSTAEMYEKYYDYLLEFRLNANYLPRVYNGAYRSDLDAVVGYALKYAADPRVTTLVLPYHGLINSNIDKEYHDEVIRALMTASLENDIDLFAKFVTYFQYFDEANGDPVRTSYLYNILTYVREYAEAFAGKESDFTSVNGYTHEKFERYCTSLVNMPQIYTGYYIPTLDQEALRFTYCPTADRYNDETERENYLNNPIDSELWWYTCVSPKNPYPSYHMDDWGYSPRVLSWMQYKYGVVGNLYWQTAFWQEQDGDLRKHIQNLYGTAMRFPGANGDGYLLYPGKYYGIDGPVGCIRLHAIRDGMEDYEAMLALQEKTEQLLEGSGVEGGTGEALSTVFDSLFDGTVISASAERMDEARFTVADMLLTALKTDAVVIDNDADGSSRKIKVFAPDGTAVTAKNLTAESVTGGKVYTVTADLTADDAELSFTATKGDVSSTVNIPLGAKRIAVADADLLKGLAFANDCGSAAAADEGVTLTFTDAANQNVRFTYAGFGGFDTRSMVLYFTIENKSDVDVTFDLRVQGTASSLAYTAMPSQTLAPGEKRELHAQLSALPWNELGALSALRFTFTSDSPAEIAISGMAVSE